MNDYFTNMGQDLEAAVRRRAHLRWHQRMRSRCGRPLAVVLAALIVAAPAVAAVSGWFGPGRPDATGLVSSRVGVGIVSPGHAQTLSIRATDPQGGPPWGLRVVQTTRGDTCVQLGRVVRGQIGTLGIAGAWHNDHRFHPIPTNATGSETCGATDATGVGITNGGILGENESAALAGIPRTGRCRYSVAPVCPLSANRIVFFGVLGPDAIRVTYRTPGGEHATQRTSAGIGAYLLVFPYTAATCTEYSQSPSRSVSCGSDSLGSASPSVPGAITSITYSNGRTCTLTSSRQSVAAPTCRGTGAQTPEPPTVSRGQVATRIEVTQFPVGVYGCPPKLRLPDVCAGESGFLNTREIPVEWRFIARRATTSSHAQYEWMLQPPTRCGRSSEYYSTDADIRAGKVLRYSTFLPATCRGRYQLTVSYAILPAQQQSGGGYLATPGAAGTVVIGHASIAIP